MLLCVAYEVMRPASNDLRYLSSKAGLKSNCWVHGRTAVCLSVDECQLTTHRSQLPQCDHQECTAETVWDERILICTVSALQGETQTGASIYSNPSPKCRQRQRQPRLRHELQSTDVGHKQIQNMAEKRPGKCCVANPDCTLESRSTITGLSRHDSTIELHTDG